MTSTPDARPASGEPAVRQKKLVLLVSVVAIAVCGLIYELLSATLSSYLFGDSVFHFSVVIGLFLSAMGVGAFVSKRIEGDLLSTFVWVEIGVGTVGGFSGLLLFAAFTYQWNFWVVLVLNCLVVGGLVGLEIPLILRLLKQVDPLRVTVGNVLGFDYIGSLLASVLFPAILVPQLGLMRTSFLFGLINVSVAALALFLFRRELRDRSRLTAAVALAALVLLGGVISGGRLVRLLEDDLYQDTIILSRQTLYQRIVITRFRSDYRLYLNGNLQFSTVDEHRYHESLVQPALSAARTPRQVLILGGGDGMALREVLRQTSVERVDLVDIDPQMVRLFASHPVLKRLNSGSFADRRVRVHHLDAMKFVERTSTRYDVILIDLPDPRTLSLGKLYSASVLRLLRTRLAPGGALTLQATSPVFSRRSFWCIVNTMRYAGWQVRPYHVNVPSFSEWGFVLATRVPVQIERLRLRHSGRFLTDAVLPTLFVFPPDIGPVSTEINRLDNQILVQYFNRDSRQWNR
ncbi:MAG: polyamine aminopropyltransferase [Myxococcales bacterium]|nr:polyamine aminopropyltransferase [Myxococcales bacterium]